MKCKKCGIGYGHGRCHGMVGIGEILLCDRCYKKWEKFYTQYKMIRFPDGIPFSWLNWSEAHDRDYLFKEWCKPKKIGCYWCKYRKQFRCCAYSKDHNVYNHKVCGYDANPKLNNVKKEKDLLMILNIKDAKDYEEYGKPYGYLCQYFKGRQFVFR